MDEPLSNLDAKLRVEMRTYLAGLHQRLRTTTLYVTHDQTEAMTMGDRVAVMRDGRLQQVDIPQVLYDRPGERLRRRIHRLAGDEPPPYAARLRERGARRGARRQDAAVAARGGSRSGRGWAIRRRELIVGVRPEDIEDASLVPSANGSTLEVRVLLAETMGAEVIAHFPLVDAPTMRSRRWSTPSTPTLRNSRAPAAKRS